MPDTAVLPIAGPANCPARGRQWRDVEVAMVRRTITLVGLLALAATRTAVAAPALDLQSLHGRVVYVDFWASWCTPCRQSFPWMEAMERKYADQGLTVVAINLDHERADADRFLRTFLPDFTISFDPDGHLAEIYGVQAMPTSVLLDRHGVRRFTHLGFRSADEADYEQHIRTLVAEH